MVQSRRVAAVALAFFMGGLCLTAQEPKKDPPPDNEKKEKEKGRFEKGKGFPGGGFGGGFGGRSQPGTILSKGTQQALKMTDEQVKSLDDMQKDVDAKLEKILTEDQRKQLKEMRDGGGRGGFGNRGPGGNPPPKKDN